MKQGVALLIRDPGLRNELAATLRASGREVLARFQSEGWAPLAQSSEVGLLVVADDLPDGDSNLISRKATEARPELEVVRISSNGDDEDGLIAYFKGGREESFSDSAELAESLCRLLEPVERRGGDTSFEAVVEAADGHPRVVMRGRNPQLGRILRMIDTIAPTDSTVLIEGESGTGKDLLARLIHQRSRRRQAPWVAVNCGAIPPSLMESELFGHEKGAFTGAHARKIGLCITADGGTLFLDEIGDLPLDMQVKLLRVLQSGWVRPVGATRASKVDIRVVAATNRDLKTEVLEKRFRLDLYYRLNVINIRLPPLRERPQDIPHLVKGIVERLQGKGIHADPLDGRTLDLLERYSWPGNIRELENIVERLLLLHPDGSPPEDEVTAQLLDVQLSPDPEVSGTAIPGAAAILPAGELQYPEEMTLKEIEEAHIRRILTRYRGNKTRAARALGINVKTLYNKMKAAGMTREEFLLPES